MHDLLIFSEKLKQLQMWKKVSSFIDDLFNDPRFSKWIARDKSSVKARCTICGCSFNLSNMGIGAVISHYHRREAYK